MPAESSGSQRTLLGIAVHSISIPLGFVGVGVVYLLSDAEFTRNNAQNALNWQIFFTISMVIAVLLGFGLGESVSTFFLFISALIIIIVGFLNFVFIFWATIKAIGGNEWTYPITPEFI